MNQAWTKSQGDEIIGSSLQGYVQVPYATLVAIFGPPHSNDGYKVDAEWILILASGNVASIYNYKDGKNYNGESGLAVELITDWHVGGKEKAVVPELEAILRQE